MSETVTSTDELSFTADGQNFDLDLTVEGSVAGSGTVTAVGGTADGHSVTGPFDAYGSDNLISTDSPYVDGYGITFEIPDYDNEQINVFEQDDGTLGAIINNGTYTASDVSLTVTCFVKGTKVATPTGQVCVEALAPGDAVLCVDGRTQAVTWIGKRDVDLASHPQCENVRPVRILPHAFGPGLPTAPLLLSPDHAIYVEGVLIPVRYLLNGTSVMQLAKGENDLVTYYHIELPAHDVLFAQGLTVESYLDTGNRNSFSNGGEVVTLFPDFSPMIWDAKGYAPLCVTGPEVARARALLAKQVVNADVALSQATVSAA
jgi:hypothetical protein